MNVLGRELVALYVDTASDGIEEYRIGLVLDDGIILTAIGVSMRIHERYITSPGVLRVYLGREILFDAHPITRDAITP
ncbi:MAG: hypothetical protein WAW59_07705 [Patescibacteria group bacterium]